MAAAHDDQGTLLAPRRDTMRPMSSHAAVEGATDRPVLSGVDLIVLFLVGLVARIIAAAPVDYAPYTDPAYYTLVAQRLASGDGFTIPVIWSFLEVGSSIPDPAVLPVASNGHWMPLTSIVAAGTMALFGETWRAGQVLMVILSALLVPMTAFAGAWLFHRRWVAILAGVLAIFSGPLLVYYPLIENFAVFGVLGAGSLMAAIRAAQPGTSGWWLVASGLLAAAATLARIDGALLTVATAVAWLVRGEFRRPSGWLVGFAAAGAFLLVVTPWLIRNAMVFGAALPSAGGSTLWITSYNEQFSIGHEVSLRTYLEAGPGVIIGSRLESWVQLIGRTAVLLGGTFLFTFIPALWMARTRRDLWPFLAYFVTMFMAMGGIFTFHAPRGAFYHSAPAWLPIAIPMALAAIPAVATAAGRVWPFLQRPQTHRFLAVAGTAGAVVLSIIGSVAIFREWDHSHQLDIAGAQFFIDAGATDDVVLFGDPATLALLSGNPGVSPSFDPYPVLEEIVDAYGARWVMVQLPEGENVDPLGLWHGGAAIDAEGNRATWLADEPAFETPDLRVFEVER